MHPAPTCRGSLCGTGSGRVTGSPSSAPKAALGWLPWQEGVPEPSLPPGELLGLGARRAAGTLPCAAKAI